MGKLKNTEYSKVKPEKSIKSEPEKVRQDQQIYVKSSGLWDYEYLP